MFGKRLVGATLVSLMLVSVGTSAMAKSSKAETEEQNYALMLGEAGEKYPVVGTGGIKVTGGHHGMWTSNIKTSAIQIDGSGISAQHYAPFTKSADFAASPNCAYFVDTSCVCTLPPAENCAGAEIVVGNDGASATVLYRSFDGSSLPGAQNGIEMSNSVKGKVDKFISDGNTWLKE